MGRQPREETTAECDGEQKRGRPGNAPQRAPGLHMLNLIATPAKP